VVGGSMQFSSERDILASQVEMLYDQAVPGFIATVVNALVITLMLRNIVSHELVYGWFAAMSSLTIIRAILVYRFQKTDKATIQYETWSSYFLVGAALAGAGWGFAGSVMLPIEHLGHQIVVMVAMAGMAAGAIPVLSSVLKIYHAYLVPLLLPLIIWLVLQQTTPHLYTAVMVVMFFIILMGAAKRINSNLIESMQLVVENRKLLEQSDESARRLSRVNRDLEREILSRRKIEDELLANKEFMEKVLASASNAIYVIDRQGKFVLVNDAGVLLAGYPAEQIIGMEFRKIIDARDLPRTEELFASSMLRGQTIRQQDVRIVTSTGEVREIVYSQSPLLEADTITGVVGSAEDVTDQRRLMRLRTEFVSTVSHELRTPLTSIRGSLGLMRGGVAGELTPELSGLTTIAYENCDRLLKLINDLLDIQKLEAGKISIYMESHDLRTLLESIAGANQGYAREYDVQLLLDQPLDAITVSVDAERFAQVLSNLISNAIKYSPTNEEVHISVTRKGDEVEIAVSDRGEGVPEEFRQRIFDKFARADGSDSRHTSGSGLGLTIARSLVEAMGGRLYFESQQGLGSTFYVALPIRD